MDISKYRDNQELSDVTVIVENKEFNLHKFPLSIASEYFKAQCKSNSKINLSEFPGGSENFEKIADHFYGKDVELTVENVLNILSGAEYLQMNGKHNLIERCEKFIDRLFRSTEYSKSIDNIVLLIDSSLNKDQELWVKAIDLIIQIWLRTYPTYSSSTNDNFLEDNLVYESILKLNYVWIVEIIKKCALDPNKRNYYGRLVADYIKFSIIDKFENDQTSTSTLNRDTSLENGFGSSESEQIEIPPRKNKNARKSRKSNYSNKSDSENTQPNQAFDAIIFSLPDDINIGIHINVNWLKQSLELCQKYRCNCKNKLLQVTGGMLPTISTNELKTMDPKDIQEMIEQCLNCSTVDPQLIEWIWDHHLLDLAKQDELDADLFLKVMKNMPEDRHIDCNVVLEIVISLLKKDNGSQQSELKNQVQLDKISPENLEEALNSKYWTSEEICLVAIARLKSMKPTPTNFQFTSNYDMSYESHQPTNSRSSPIQSPKLYRTSSWRKSPIYSATKSSHQSQPIASTSNSISPNHMDSFDNSPLVLDYISPAPISSKYSSGYIPTKSIAHYRSAYSPDSYISLEESLRLELQRINDTYQRHRRERNRSRSNRRYPLY